MRDLNSEFSAALRTCSLNLNDLNLISHSEGTKVIPRKISRELIIIVV